MCPAFVILLKMNQSHYHHRHLTSTFYADMVWMRLHGPYQFLFRVTALLEGLGTIPCSYIPFSAGYLWLDILYFNIKHFIECTGYHCGINLEDVLLQKAWRALSTLNYSCYLLSTLQSVLCVFYYGFSSRKITLPFVI